MNQKRRSFLSLFVWVTLVILVGAIGFIGCGGSSGGDSGGGDVTPTATTTTSSGLDYDTTYYWQVEAVSSSGAVSEGDAWVFRTESSYYSQSKGTAITEDEAKVVAANHLTKDSNRSEIKAKYGSTLANISKSTLGDPKKLTGSKDSTTLAYVFELEPKGYIVVAAHRSITPVIAYSYESSFSWKESSQNILLNMLRYDISKRLSAYDKGLVPKDTLSKNYANWERYKAGAFSTDKTEKSVYGPLFTFTTWSQESPYNSKCPMDPTTNDRCIVGCVATSMAQMLNYWKSPTSLTLTSSDSYTTSTRHIAVDATTASFSGISYNNGNPSSDVKAKLSFAAGVLVQMDYTSTFAGAYTSDSYYALKNRLGYDNVQYQEFMYAPFDSTNIISSVEQGYPVQMGIYTANYQEGHAINVDGYDSSNSTFHLNMGWAGDSDGWYSLPNGMPAGYTIVHSIVYNVYPTGVTPTPTPTATATVTPTPTPTSTGTPDVPTDPYPVNGQTNVSVSSTLVWSSSSGARSYNIYIWPSNSSKPSQPTASGLTSPQYTP
ncbi:MAG: C10 family peptidase [Firmicutes bacterium]|nr:C10 family peptidase [Bacillota bacterium]